MYERFTDRARIVMQLSTQESKAFDHQYIGTEHILLGLVKEGSGVASHVLRDLKLDLQRIRIEVEKAFQACPEMVVTGKRPLTPAAKRVIESALVEARNLGHNYIGTEHLLLGLIREQEGVAAQVLINLGLTLEVVRNQIRTMLGIGVESANPNSDDPAIPVEVPSHAGLDPAIRRILAEGAQQPVMCKRKFSAVWCIHILAYVFSLLVLAVSAFSHSSGLYLTGSAKTGGNSFVVYVCSGEYFLVRQYDFPFPRESEFALFDLDRWPAIERNYSRQTKDFHFLFFTRYSGISGTTYFGMLQSFLLLPMAWLSGFYLFKLRRRFRKRSAHLQPNMPCVPSE